MTNKLVSPLLTPLLIPLKNKITRSQSRVLPHDDDLQLQNILPTLVQRIHLMSLLGRVVARHGSTLHESANVFSHHSSSRLNWDSTAHRVCLRFNANANTEVRPRQIPRQDTTTLGSHPSAAEY